MIFADFVSSDKILKTASFIKDAPKLPPVMKTNGLSFCNPNFFSHSSALPFNNSSLIGFPNKITFSFLKYSPAFPNATITIFAIFPITKLARPGTESDSWTIIGHIKNHDANDPGKLANPPLEKTTSGINQYTIHIA